MRHNLIFKVWVLASALIIINAAEAKTQSDVPSKAPVEAHPKISCNSHQLESFDCHLKLDNYHFHFRKNKIHLNNEIWKKLFDFPITGEDVTWKKIELKKLGTRYFIEFLAWGPSSGEGAIQSLRWVVQEAREEQLHGRIDRVVQKRTINLKAETPSYHYDDKEKFNLGVNKMGQILWYTANESGGL